MTTSTTGLHSMTLKTETAENYLGRVSAGKKFHAAALALSNRIPRTVNLSKLSFYNNSSILLSASLICWSSIKYSGLLSFILDLIQFFCKSYFLKRI